MTKTDYLKHLLEEYASYLKRAVTNNSGKTYTFTAVDFAAALMRAFEKGATKGVLYESLNDVERVASFADEKKEEPKKEQPAREPQVKQMTQEDVAKALTDLFGKLFQ